MTYPASMKVVKLDDSRHYMFTEQLKKIESTSTDKNRDWWSHLIKKWNVMFDSWYLVLDENEEIISFSAVQPFNNDQWRLLSRLWNGVKKKGLTRGLIKDELSPAMLMLECQLNDYSNKKCFISMEYINRRQYMAQLSEKINNMFNANWSLNEGMQQTCGDTNSFSCWQNTISNSPIDLPTMTVEHYIEIFEKKRKRIKK